MSRLKAVLATAAPQHRDVPVVLNGELAEERKALLDKLTQAAFRADKDARLAQAAVTPARDALDEWDAEHKDAVLWVRLVQQPHSVWRMLIRKHPMAKNVTSRDLFDNRHGFSVIPAVIEYLEKYALIVDGDEEEKPDAAEWTEFFKAVSPGDMFQIAVAVTDIHNQTSEQAYGDLVKA